MTFRNVLKFLCCSYSREKITCLDLTKHKTEHRTLMSVTSKAIVSKIINACILNVSRSLIKVQ